MSQSMEGVPSNKSHPPAIMQPRSRTFCKGFENRAEPPIPAQEQKQIWGTPHIMAAPTQVLKIPISRQSAMIPGQCSKNATENPSLSPIDFRHVDALDREDCTMLLDRYQVPAEVHDWATVSIKSSATADETPRITRFVKQVTINNRGERAGQLSLWDLTMIGVYLRKMRGAIRKKDISMRAELRLASLIPETTRTLQQSSEQEMALEEQLYKALLRWSSLVFSNDIQMRRFACPICGLLMPNVEENMKHMKEAHISYASSETLPALSEVSAITKHIGGRYYRSDQRYTAAFRSAALQITKEGSTGVTVMLRFTGVRRRRRYRTLGLTHKN